MTDYPIQPAQDATPAPIAPEPVWQDVEAPESATATVVLPSELYAPWMRRAQLVLAGLGAEEDRDYKSRVVLAGFDAKKRKVWRVTWRARSERGLRYLQIMAFTVTAELAAEAKELGHESQKAGEGEDPDAGITPQPE